jgi:dihydrofolate reductase
VDVLIMGRRTFEKVLTFGGWPFSKPVIVLSSGSVYVPPELSTSVETMSGTPGEIVARLAARGMRDAYIDGGATITRFLEAGLIQRIIITRIPVLIGSGIPLFGPLSRDIRLKHMETRTYRSGLVQHEYEVVA